LCTLEVWVLWTCKTFLICVKLWTYKFCNQWKIFLKKLCQIKLLCFHCDFSNIQNCNFQSVRSLGWLLWHYFCPKRCGCWLCLHICTLINSYLNPLKMVDYVS
jgi:hypothetical protein